MELLHNSEISLLGMHTEKLESKYLNRYSGSHAHCSFSRSCLKAQAAAEPWMNEWNMIQLWKRGSLVRSQQMNLEDIRLRKTVNGSQKS